MKQYTSWPRALTSWNYFQTRRTWSSMQQSDNQKILTKTSGNCITAVTSGTVRDRNTAGASSKALHSQNWTKNVSQLVHTNIQTLHPVTHSPPARHKWGAAKNGEICQRCLARPERLIFGKWTASFLQLQQEIPQLFLHTHAGDCRSKDRKSEKCQMVILPISQPRHTMIDYWTYKTRQRMNGHEDRTRDTEDKSTSSSPRSSAPSR